MAEADSSDRIWLEVSILASASEGAHPEPQADKPALVEATVLVVARDADMRAYIRDCLSATGLRLVELSDLAATAAGAIEHADLLIIDLSRQERSSGERHAELKIPPHYAHLPRVLITDESHDAGHAATRNVALLHRPFNARRLQLEVMRSLCT